MKINDEHRHDQTQTALRVLATSSVDMIEGPKAAVNWNATLRRELALADAATALLVLWVLAKDEDQYADFMQRAVTAIEAQYEDAVWFSKQGDFDQAAVALLG